MSTATRLPRSTAAAIANGIISEARAGSEMLESVGSQVQGWGVVFGFALGMIRTFAAPTTISAVNGAPMVAALASAAQQTDTALKTYGYVPTLTLRLGFDLLSVRTR